MEKNINEINNTAAEAKAETAKPAEEVYQTYYFEMSDGLIMSAIGRNRTEAYLALMGR